jgi:hypothetical protein
VGKVHICDSVQRHAAILKSKQIEAGGNLRKPTSSGSDTAVERIVQRSYRVSVHSQVKMSFRVE